MTTDASRRVPTRNGLPVRFYVYRGTGVDTLTAWMDDEPAPRRSSTGRILQPCGTMAAYQRHHRRREPPCALCLEANRLNWEAREGGSDGPRNTRRREAYRLAREAGMTPREANGHKNRRAAA